MYLVRTIMYIDSDMAAVNHNMQKAQQRWGVISKVLTKKEAMVQANGILYKPVAQTVLIYGSESCVMTGEKLNLLEGFPHIYSCRIAGMRYWRSEEREWEHSPVADAMEAAGIWPIKEHI